jgi:ActR/RegA family two-component response regulator
MSCGLEEVEMKVERRVLVIENDLDFQKAVARSLESKGYKVFVARDAATALRLLEREHIHVATIDIRLRQHSDPKDLSGLKLARSIQSPVAKIILTAYPSLATVKESWKEARAFDFVSKQEDPQALFQAIDRAFLDQLGLRDDLEIEWEGDNLSPWQIAEEIELVGFESQHYEHEVVEILLKLFSSAEADNIVVARLMTPQRARLSSQSGAVLLKATPYYKGKRRATKVVKLAERAMIEAEVENYRRYVQPFIETARYASQEGSPQYTLRVGGIIYTLFGADLDKVQDLSVFYAQREPSEIDQLLHSLFSDTCKLWYNNREHKGKQSIPALYKDMLHLSLEKLETVLEKEPKLARYRPGAAAFEFPGIERSFVNPLRWLEKNFDADLDFSITHGDMHSRNVLVDDLGQAWLIDFARTGEGHILRDFIELESDIKFTLLDEVDVVALCDFELALVSPGCWDDAPHLGQRFDRPALNKAFAVVRGLRTLVSRFHPMIDKKEYYHALLYQTLNIVRLSRIDPLKKQHALLAAALICERLQDWDGPWPPAGSKCGMSQRMR